MFENLCTAGAQFGISYLWAQEGTWITADDEVKKLENMGKDHLINCIDMLNRQVRSIPITFIEFLKNDGKKYLEQALKNEGKKLSKLNDKELDDLHKSIFIIINERLKVKIRELNAELKKRV